MKIKTLKDLKYLLNKIDDKDLIKVGIGTNEEGDNEINLVTEEPFDDIHVATFKKLRPLENYLKAILKAYEKGLDDEDFTTQGFIES